MKWQEKASKGCKSILPFVRGSQRAICDQNTDVDMATTEEVVDLTTVPEDLHDDGILDSQDAASHGEQDTDMATTEEVVDLTTVPEDLHDDGILDSRQDAASHGEQDTDMATTEEVVDLTTVPEDLHDDGILDSRQDAASHGEQDTEMATTEEEGDYGESGISLMQQLRPLHALVSQSRDERESRRPAIEGCMALVLQEHFESLCAIERRVRPITAHDGSSHPCIMDACHLMQGNRKNEKTALAYDIYSDTTLEGTLFRKEEYPSLVPISSEVTALEAMVCVEDVIEWMTENLDGFVLEEVQEAFKDQQFGAFVAILRNQNMIDMMEDVYSGYLRPIVKVKELKVSIGLFDLILHIMQPGVCRMYLLDDDHTVAPSHVPGLFCDSENTIHLYWSHPWPLGIVDTGAKGDDRAPFSCNEILVMSNGVCFSPSTGSMRHFNRQGHIMSSLYESGSQKIITAGDLVHGALYGLSLDRMRNLRQDNAWENDHCPIFHMNHSVHCMRLTTRSENSKNQILGRTPRIARHLTREEAEERYGRIDTTPGNDDDPTQQWIPAYLAYHSYTTRDLAAFCAENREISIPLQRVEGLWVHKDTSMLCSVCNGVHSFIMPEDCLLCERAMYPRICATIDGESHTARVHLILHDSFMRHIDPGYMERPLVQRLPEDGRCHIMVVDHVDQGEHGQRYSTREENRMRRLTPRCELLELISAGENTLRAIGTQLYIEIQEEGPAGRRYSYQCTGMEDIFRFLKETLNAIIEMCSNISVQRLLLQREALKYWWEINFLGGTVAMIIREKKISIAMNGIQVINHGDVDKYKVDRLKYLLAEQRTDQKNPCTRTWVLLYFGDDYQKTVRFTCGMTACKDLMYQYVPDGEDIILVTDSAMEQLRPTGNCIKFYKCIARPLNRTPSSEEMWNRIGHVPLSMMLNRQYEEIANHYERVFAQVPPQGRFQPSCNAPRAKIKECTETVEMLQLLHHVSTCASDPCRGKYCPQGLQECDRLNALGHHIRGCEDPQCTFPECQEWNVAMKTHWRDVESEKCRDSGCLMCALNRPTTLDTGERNRIGGRSFRSCREGLRSQLLRIYNEKRKINQEQAGGSQEHTSKCRSCLMHAIQLMPAENAHKTFLWSLDGYAGKTSNNNCDILKSMIQNIINHRGEILALWNNGQEDDDDDVWDMVTALMVFGDDVCIRNSNL